jgi:hypothetical protein
MRKLLPMLRLHFEADLSIRQIAASLKLWGYEDSSGFVTVAIIE